LGCPAHFAKIFPFQFDPTHFIFLRCLVPHRGAARDRHERGAGRGGRKVRS
jgi:hypothetical protein